MKMYTFKYAKELEIQLANQIGLQLERAISKNGKANMLVSGGTSPIGVFHLLSLKSIDWSKVTIGLVDERYVSSNDQDSNEKLVRENLLINLASQATFIPMVYNLESEIENLAIANDAYNIFQKSIDVCILGMGEDGHTASLFPADKASELNLIGNSLNLVSTISPKAPYARISCAKSMLLHSNFIFLMIVGEAKKNVLQKSIANKLPISYILENEQKIVDIYYAEKK
jgi:6-phosphogluconolactonase